MEVLMSRKTVLAQLSSLVNAMPTPSTDVDLRYVGTPDQFRNAMYGCCGHFETSQCLQSCFMCILTTIHSNTGVDDCNQINCQ